MKILRITFILLLPFFILSAGYAEDARGIKRPKPEKPEQPVTQPPPPDFTQDFSRAARVALIIGNGGYSSGSLNKSINNAQDMAAILKTLGFEIELLLDLNQRNMYSAIRAFKNRLIKNSVGLFYYSGHAVQAGGVNYLIPVDAPIRDGNTAFSRYVSADFLMKRLKEARSQRNIVILDAYRYKAGMAKMAPPPGTLIVSAAGSNRKSAGVNKGNSPFTESLKQHITKPGQDVTQLIGKISKDMRRRGFREPRIMGSMPGRFCFTDRPVVTPPRHDPPPLKETMLVVNANVIGAHVWFNGKNYGAVPKSFKLYQSGSYKIRIAARGYRDYEKDVQIKLGASVEINARLEQVASGPPPEYTPPRPEKDRTGRGEWRELHTGMDFIFVQGGCYNMGNKRVSDEKPVHPVCLDDFFMGKYEVTQAQWAKVMGNNPSSFKNCGGNCPVEKVSWIDAQAFIRKLNQINRGSYIFRLPTEAEWEYAARSRGKEEIFSGGSDADDVGWFVQNSERRPHPAGTRKANGLGIHDMSGNVWEWCLDTYERDAYIKHPKKNPVNPPADLKSSGTYSNTRLNRVFRGGSWINKSPDLRCTNRHYSPAGRKKYYLGFRVLMVQQ